MPEWIKFVDVLIIAALLLFALGGYQKGFAAQIAQLVTFIFIGITLFFGYPAIYAWLEGLFRNTSDRAMTWMLLGVLALIAILITKLFSQLLAFSIKINLSDFMDTILGLLFGLFRGGFIIFFFMVVSVLLGPIEIYQVYTEKSYIGKFICYEAVPIIQPKLTRSNVNKKIREIRRNMRNKEEAGNISF